MTYPEMGQTMNQNELIKHVVSEVQREVIKPMLEAHRQVVVEAANALAQIGSEHCAGCQKAEIAQAALERLGRLNADLARAIQRPI